MKFHYWLTPPFGHLSAINYCLSAINYCPPPGKNLPDVHDDRVFFSRFMKTNVLSTTTASRQRRILRSSENLF